MSKVQKICQGLAVSFLAASVLSGCSYVVKSGANVALGFTEKHVVPPILAMQDAEMVCNTGSALTPAIMSTKGMGADPTRVAVLMYAASGVCAENQALEQELRYLRASKAGQVTEAQEHVLHRSVGLQLLLSDNTQAISSLLIVGNLNINII